jgi:hypothetical protein
MTTCSRSSFAISEGTHKRPYQASKKKKGESKSCFARQNTRMQPFFCPAFVVTSHRLKKKGKTKRRDGNASRSVNARFSQLSFRRAFFIALCPSPETTPYLCVPYSFLFLSATTSIIAFFFVLVCVAVVRDTHSHVQKKRRSAFQRARTHTPTGTICRQRGLSWRIHRRCITMPPRRVSTR